MAKAIKSTLDLGVTVKMAGGMTATQKTIMQPLAIMAAMLAQRIRDRVVYEGQNHRGGNFGAYSRLVTGKKGLAGVSGRRGTFWTGPGLPLSSNRLAVDKEGRQLITSWGDYRAGVHKREWLSTQNFYFTGGLWRSLTTKAQASGKRITVGFLGSSQSKRGPRVSNRDKAWSAMSPFAERGMHPLQPTKSEIDAFAGAWRAWVGPRLLRDLEEAAKLSKQLRAKTKGNRKLRARLLALH